MHVKCLPGARMSLMISDDGTLHASAQHLLENFMRLAAAEPPPYRPLSRDGLNEKGNLSGETTTYTVVQQSCTCTVPALANQSCGNFVGEINEGGESAVRSPLCPLLVAASQSESQLEHVQSVSYPAASPLRRCPSASNLLTTVLRPATRPGPSPAQSFAARGEGGSRR